MIEPSEVSTKELVELAAVDSEFYCRHFFPKAFRQISPTFHSEIWKKLENPNARYVGMKVYRGGAKTTLLRAFTSKRIAYAFSRTILFIGKGERHALSTLDWVKRNIQFNPAWANTFKLEKGSKWAGEEIEIINRAEDCSIRLAAMGITGQIRGINFDNYRPDLIVVDDPCDEENTSTPEGRKKMDDLLFGALYNSLEEETECPDATLALLQTPLNREDLIAKCSIDPEWNSVTFGCFNDEGKSRWEARHPTPMLYEKKQAFINRNQLSLWLREMECKVVSPETAAFDINRVKYWDVLPEGGMTVFALDPVPPPSERQLSQGLRHKDFECIMVLKAYKGEYFVCEYAVNRGHDPDWTIAEFFRLLDKWKPLRGRVETTNYQRTLKWILEKEMRKRRRYVQINSGQTDRRGKTYKIIDAINGPLFNGRLYLHKSQSVLIQQVTEYPDVNHDDVIETLAECISEVNEGTVIEGEYDVLDDFQDVPPLEDWRCSP